jgi:hypothetical protein
MLRAPSKLSHPILSARSLSAGKTFANMVRTDGVVGMYRGLGPPVCMMMLMNSMNFTAFGAIKDSLAVGFALFTTTLLLRVRTRFS